MCNAEKVVFLKGVPDWLGILPEEDQDAIRAAVGQTMLLVGYNELGEAECEFHDADNNIHTIWVKPELIQHVE